MKKKELQELTTEELKTKTKTLKAVLIIISSLVFLYLVYFIYKLTTGTWEANNTLNPVMLGMLVVVISITTVRYSSIAKILQHRKEEK
jgi:archaellum component FlaF (FlaF/FlaG flagellin family)